MNLSTDRAHGIAIVRVGETRLMYPLLADFSGAVMGLLTSGDKKVMIDLSKVTYVDSATIGCLMDLYRQATAAGGQLRLAGVNKRVRTRRAPSRASGASHAQHQDHIGRRDCSRRRPARGARNPLSRGDGPQRAGAIVRGHEARDRSFDR